MRSRILPCVSIRYPKSDFVNINSQANRSARGLRSARSSGPGSVDGDDGTEGPHHVGELRKVLVRVRGREDRVEAVDPEPLRPLDQRTAAIDEAVHAELLEPAVRVLTTGGRVELAVGERLHKLDADRAHAARAADKRILAPPDVGKSRRSKSPSHAVSDVSGSDAASAKLTVPGLRPTMR